MRNMAKRMFAIILICVLAASIGRSQALEKGEVRFFTNTAVVAQKVNGGVLLWSRDDIANKRTWIDAHDLIFVKLKDTRGIKKGKEFEIRWRKCIGTYRHGNCLVGYRDIPAFERPSDDEIKQAKYEYEKIHEQIQTLLETQEKKRLMEEEQRRKKRLMEEEQRRFEEERKRIKDDAEQEKIKRELQRQREENDRKLEAERIKMEIDAKKQRQEETRKAEEERKRRYPIEQKERAEYAEMKLKDVLFDINLYLFVQKDLRRYIYSMEITERNWAVLAKAHRSRNWLGMLSLINGNELNDYPDTGEIDYMVKILKEQEFHIEILFTHLTRRCDINAMKLDEKYFYREKANCDFSGSLIVPFTIGEGNVNFVCCTMSSTPRMPEKDSSELDKINKDVGLGRISQSEAESRFNRIKEEYPRKIWNWLETSKIDHSWFDEKVEGRTNSSRSNMEFGSNPVTTGSVRPSPSGSQPKWITCPDCGGSRYISKGRCDKCHGVGRYRTAISHGIGNRQIGGRMTQCDKCNGKGEIKETCKTCYGRGKIKQ